MNKKKIVVSVFVGALLLMLVFNQGIAYEKHMSEGIGIDKVKSGAYMTLTVVKADGSRVLAWSGHNVMTTFGLNACREQIAGVWTADFDWIGIGTGAGGGSGSTNLTTLVFIAQGTYAALTQGNWTITYTWPASTFSGEAITEAGVFDATGAGGILLNYQTFGAITLTAADSLEVEFEFEIS